MSITFKANKIPRRRTHGFRARMKSKGGRKILKRRRQRECWKLTVSDERNCKTRRY